MKYIFLVAWREYVENARTKGFWIGILLLPAILFVAIQVPIWLEKKAAPIRYYVLVDQSTNFASVVEARLERSHQRQVLNALNDYARKHATLATGSNQFKAPSLDDFMKAGGATFYLEQIKPRLNANAPPFPAPRRIYQKVELPAGLNAAQDIATLAQELKPYLRGEKKIQIAGQWVALSAAVLVPRDLEKQIVRPRGAPRPPGSSGIEYWAGNLADNRLRDEIEQTANSEIRRREFLVHGLNEGTIRDIEQTYVPFSSLNPRKEVGQESVSRGDVMQQWLPSAFVYLLWVSIFGIVQMLLNNVIEEKSNRIIEVLLSSVTPGELMMGKLFGIAAVGLTMVGVWIFALVGILSWKSGGGAELPSQVLGALKASPIIPMFGVYFIFGYLLYAACILALGSVCNTIKEAQSYMGMITMIMMIPLLTMTFIPKDPNGVLARVLSWIPIYTPFTMMNRVMAEPPLFDLVGTLILLVVCTAGALWMAAKVFRIGILRTGQPPRIVEMLRWLRRS